MDNGTYDERKVKLPQKEIQLDSIYRKKPVYDFLKRAFDIICSFIALVILLPVFLIISIIISCGDRQGKPFFVQKRCGKNGREFKFYKFRTMCVNAEQQLESLKSRNGLRKLKRAF